MCMKKALVLMIMMLCVGASAHAEVFDFEDLHSSGGTANNSYETPDFRFTATHYDSFGQEVNQGYLSWYATTDPNFNTSKALFNKTYSDAVVEWTNFFGRNGQTFHFESIDLDHYLNPTTAGYDASFLIGETEFYGYDAGGNQVAFASVPYAEGWSTYTFDATFENVSKVKWSSAGYALPNDTISIPQFDNVKVTVTPEPLSAILFGVGGLSLFGFKRRNNRLA
jgi:hypothetical protein